jgi:hypothetical protein
MKRLLSALLVSLGLTAGGLIALNREDPFPHEEHARLFPLCIGCHEGIPEDDGGRFYPAVALCTQCHNGTEQKRVAWTNPTPYVSNLKFSHSGHNAKEQLECSDCHTRAGAPRMAVARTVPDRCFACHAHRAQNHFVDARCAQCHVPLAQTRLVAARVAALPEPPSHRQPDFLEKLHGDLARDERARCEMCHTRERCAACHVDANQSEEIQAFAPAGPGLQLPTMKARYFVPESHERRDWIDRHGGPARADISNCAACHTRESCTTCHAAGTPRAVLALPSRTSIVAPGVAASRRAPSTHSAPFFEEQHGPLAAASRATCLGCHVRTQCEKCHNSIRAGRDDPRSATASTPSVALTKSSVVQDTSRPRRASVRHSASYHPANFMERHANAAYNRNLECANCHETARFCRDCHERRGMGTTGRLQAGFHDAQPLWLLNHGKPARQGLESCASCHKQTDCMQCHSSIGAFRISPHGPGFDARRVQERNARLCFACHLTDPLQGRTQ